MWEVNPCEDTGWEYVSRSWLELTLPPWMFANPRFTGSLWPEVSGTAVWAGGRTYRFPSHQEGLPSAASALQFGQKGSFPQGDGCFSVPAADYLNHSESALWTGCLINGHSAGRGSDRALCKLPCSGPRYLHGTWTELCGLQFLLITKANSVFTYLPRCTFFCISLCGSGSLEIWMEGLTF